MSPFGQMWLALHAPSILLVALWTAAAAATPGRARWVWLAAAALGGSVLGLDVAALLQGELPWASNTAFPQIAWAGLAGALALGDRRRTRAHLWSFGLAIGAVAAQAWLPAIVLLGTGHGERSWALRIGLAVLLFATLTGTHWTLAGFRWVSWFALSADATSLAVAWGNGALELAGWAIVARAIDRLPR